jgi:protein dithiol oxidoreductase (disulfide-forming)
MTRMTSAIIATITATIIAMLVALAGTAQAQPFEEGKHYQRIGTPVTTPDDRVEVIEAFAYPCPACRSFLPIITEWETNKPDYVDFSRLPVGLQQGWDLFARAYYTAEVMGLGEEAHAAVFRAVHDERRPVRRFEDIAAIYEEFDVSTERFVNTSQSFAVDSRMRRNRTDVSRYGVRQTPTMIVQGRWRLSPGNFDSYQEMLAAIDYLVEREAQALGLQTNNTEEQADADVPAVVE